MRTIGRSRRLAVAALAALASFLLLSTAVAFAPGPMQQHSHHVHAHAARQSTRTASPSGSGLPMSLSDVSDFYAQFPLQAAVLTCGVKASAADGIAQARAPRVGAWDWGEDLEFRRNLAYVLYGGIFVGALCHYEYDVVFPLLFGDEGGIWTAAKEVLLDCFVSAPLVWLPPAYLIKAVVYDYSLMEGLQKYRDDVLENGLLQKYWTIWVPAQSVSFTVVPDHLRVAFMAAVSFFWFILFSTVSSNGGSAGAGASEDNQN